MLWHAIKWFATCTVVLLITSCGPDKEPAGEARGDTAATATRADAGAGSSAQANRESDDLGEWFEPEATPAPQSSSAGKTFMAPTPKPPADAETVIARYTKECPAGTNSAACRELRLEVEGVFLEALTTVRASQDVDPNWYRVAAAAETPQLACIGLTEVIFFKARTAEDDAVIAAALDSPWLSLRRVVMANANGLPALGGMFKRTAQFDRFMAGTCFDAARDSTPGVKWAGNYPGARYRYFASSPSLRWFTTPDPAEKVIAWFAQKGKVARTAEQLVADAQARMMDELNRLSEKSDPGDEARIMGLMLGQGSDAAWSEHFQNIEGAGEIKYVKIGAKQAVAIFRDDLLQATSIVAPQPKPPPDLKITADFDMEKAQREAMEKAQREYHVRQIYGF